MHISSTCDTSINHYSKCDQEKNIRTCRSTQCWQLSIMLHVDLLVQEKRGVSFMYFCTHEIINLFISTDRSSFPNNKISIFTGFSEVRVTQSLVLCVCFVDRCLSFCTFSFWPLWCLFFFDLWMLITNLVYSNSSSFESAFGHKTRSIAANQT